MRVEDFDFDLPEERIALRPARPRDSARLLLVRPEGTLADHHVFDLPSLLRPGDLLVFNESRVIRAALTGERPGRGEGPAVRFDVNLHERTGPDAWRAFLRPAKRARVGDILRFGDLEARVEEKQEGEALLRFSETSAVLDAALERVGAPPLPPYIARKRRPDARDDEDYQTVFANMPGSVAAPTAGLHFTPGLLAALAEAGVQSARVTLHVGAGTFLPMKGPDTADHVMHSERYQIPGSAADAINAAKAAGRRVIPVGTTALRTLEAAGQSGVVQPGAGATDIFITPGYCFRIADALLTNFHLPRSTLFMLVSAFSGLDAMKRAYRHAVEYDYRFYSYGDACLLHPPVS
jgi:S-adenosylmethionine:tRNA ribosyltransferase-isomerase